jgi:hypothetical protein
MLIDGEYVITAEEKRRDRAMALLENEEAVQHLKAVHGKIRTLGVQLTELGSSYTRLANSSAAPYLEELFLDELEMCTECFDPEVLKGLVAAKRTALKRLEKSRKTVNPD